MICIDYSASFANNRTVIRAVISSAATDN